ncbi:uncharacterized protein LOC105431232 [Pogonomyrmex barbatus]|uniref:Uncharacterized protein LOC105431232 n=1 Tax=Pogonomyrmex barbatus TaxID=144034 RepID=A0A6I9XEL4_9HYME|nr:uncharacterized protein LOC105431232 [Pogonomyrmex barbatus]
MFESDDWIFDDVFDDVEEETKTKSHLPCQNKENTPIVKRRKLDNCEASLSSTDDTFVQKLLSDAPVNIVDKNTAKMSSNNRNDLSQRNLLKIFQKNISQKIFDSAKEINKDSTDIQRESRESFESKMNAISKVIQSKESKKKNHKSVTDVRIDKEIKLIRIFPGPAGLIPDRKNVDISDGSYLNSVKEFENETVIKCVEMKSQDEKNVFEEKTWKLLLNDLPNNFLQDYRISTVKNRANASHCDVMKVKFVAGILDYVDHSYDDPFVILKDSTDSIEGTIHRNIVSTYPGILEPNIVIFLRDVGLLKITTNVVTNKYHILISLVNLLAIYSDKGRIISTSFMDDISSCSSSVESNRDGCKPVSKLIYVSELSKIDENHDLSLQTSSSMNQCTSIANHKSHMANDSLSHLTNEKYQSRQKNDEGCKIMDEKVFERFDYSMDANNLDIDDDFFITDCDFLEEQNYPDHSLSKTISQANKTERCDLQMQNKCLEERNTKEELAIEKKKKEQNSLQTLQKCVTNVKTLRDHHAHENCLSSDDIMIHEISNLNMKSTVSAIKANVKNSKTLVSYFTNDKYDSDDEILSQLDVDTSNNFET